jgi:hypothetical protein
MPLGSSGVAGVQELQNGTTGADLSIVIRRFEAMKEFYSAGSLLGAIFVPGNGYLPNASWLLNSCFRDSHRAAFQPEIGLSVLETNSSHQVAKQFFVHRDFATVHFLAKQIAKDPSKIFVSRIRHEASGIR